MQSEKQIRRDKEIDGNGKGERKKEFLRGRVREGKRERKKDKEIEGEGPRGIK